MGGHSWCSMSGAEHYARTFNITQYHSGKIDSLRNRCVKKEQKQCAPNYIMVNKPYTCQYLYSTKWQIILQSKPCCSNNKVSLNKSSILHLNSIFGEGLNMTSHNACLSFSNWFEKVTARGEAKSLFPWIVGWGEMFLKLLPSMQYSNKINKSYYCCLTLSWHSLCASSWVFWQNFWPRQDILCTTGRTMLHRKFASI